MTALELKRLLNQMTPRPATFNVDHETLDDVERVILENHQRRGIPPIIGVGRPGGGVMFYGVELFAREPVGYETLDTRPAENDGLPLCPRCGSAGHQLRPAGNGDLNHFLLDCSTCEMEFSYCAKCRKPWTAPMSPFCRDQHEPPTTYHPFIPYFDFALGVEVTSLAERHKHMRNAHVDYRDKLTKAQLGEREERKRHEQQERERGHAPGGSQRTSGRVFSR